MGAYIRFFVEKKLCIKKTCLKLAFVQILVSSIKLSITMKIGQFALIRWYTYVKRKHSKFLYKIPSVLSNPALSYMTDPAIIEIREIA